MTCSHIMDAHRVGLGKKRRVKCYFTVAFIATCINKCTRVFYFLGIFAHQKNHFNTYMVQRKVWATKKNPEKKKQKNKEPKRMRSPQSSGSRKVCGKEAWSCASTGFTLGMELLWHPSRFQKDSGWRFLCLQVLTLKKKCVLFLLPLSCTAVELWRACI